MASSQTPPKCTLVSLPIMYSNMTFLRYSYSVGSEKGSVLLCDISVKTNKQQIHHNHYP